MIKFKLYSDNFLSSVAKGVGIGSALGMGVNKVGNLLLNGIRKVGVDKKTGEAVYKGTKGSLSTVLNKAEGNVDKFIDSINLGPNIIKKLKGTSSSFFDNLRKIGEYILSNPRKAAFVGALIGASLAIGYYLIKKSSSSISKARAKYNASNGRLIDKVTDNLKKTGFINGRDYTTDPSTADYIKSKVCMIIDLNSDEACLSINSVSDPKLGPVTKKIIKNLPGGYRYYSRESDKNNELTLVSLPTNSFDHVYISSIAERFIKKGFPVFIIEIN